MQTRNKHKTCVIKVYFKKQLRLDSPLLYWDGTADAKVDGNKDWRYSDFEKEAENSCFALILLIYFRITNESKLSLKGPWNDCEAYLRQWGVKVMNPLGLTVLVIVTSLVQFEC